MFFSFQKAFGLDISDSSIKALELKRKFGKLYPAPWWAKRRILLEAYGRVKLEKGIVDDGKILNKEKLKEKIIELLQSTEPRVIKTKDVILSLPESKTFFHIFKLPVNLKGEELYSAVEREALKTIPLDPIRVYFDFQVISRKNALQEVLYAGALKETIDEYKEVLREAGLKPLVLDIESASLARAFKTEMIKEGGVLIVDIGARTTILTIFDDGSIRLSATVPIAGSHFTKAISEKLKLSLEKAEELKRNYGLNPEKEGGRIPLVLQGLLQDILNELKNFIGFYENKSGRKIKKILLCGGSSFLPKFASYFVSNLDVETLVPDPWEGIDVEELFRIKELRKLITTKLHPVFFADVIGLARRGLEKNPETAGINLMSPEEMSKPVFIRGRLRQSKTFGLLVLGFFIASFIFLGRVIQLYIFKPIPVTTPTFYQEEMKGPVETPLTEELGPEERDLQEENILPEQVSPVEEKKEEEIPMVTIGKTETGWLRVREKPGTIYPELTKVYPGESYPLLEESEGWYRIELEGGREGWVFSKYASKQ